MQDKRKNSLEKVTWSVLGNQNVQAKRGVLERLKQTFRLKFWLFEAVRLQKQRWRKYLVGCLHRRSQLVVSWENGFLS